MYDIPAGQQIPGSRYFRAYCTRCDEPMRVFQEDVHKENYCEECDPPKLDDHSTNLTPRQRHGLGKTR